MKGTVKLVGPPQRAYAKSLIDRAPEGWIVSLREPTRTLDQNARLWAMIGDVATAAPEGRRHTPETWKSLFMHALGHSARFEMGLNGEPFPVGFRSSHLTVRQMADLITFIQAWGDERGIAWSEPHPDERAA